MKEKIEKKSAAKMWVVLRVRKTTAVFDERQARVAWRAVSPPQKELKTGAKNDLTKAIKIKDIKPIDETAVHVLRAISQYLGDRESAFVNYTAIGRTVNEPRAVVASAVKRMIARGILREENGKLSIVNAILIES